MAPSEHLDWLEENIRWFEDLAIDSLRVQVPCCPGWDVAKVLTHLAYGLGMAYPAGLAAAPDSNQDDAFASLPWPSRLPSGVEAKTVFADLMGECLSAFRAADPETPCWTYSGPGVAGFWFRRAAIETTLHRMDVHDALLLPGPDLSPERLDDAVADAVEFVLPLAAELAGEPKGDLAVRISSTGREHVVGRTPIATVIGDGAPLLGVLWGRANDEVQIEGDSSVATAWFDLIGEAFAGR